MQSVQAYCETLLSQAIVMEQAKRQAYESFRKMRGLLAGIDAVAAELHGGVRTRMQAEDEEVEEVEEEGGGRTGRLRGWSRLSVRFDGGRVEVEETAIVAG